MTTNYKCHAKCRLTFTPKDRYKDPKEYSDRTVIELRQGDDLTVTLLAKDVPNANANIFSMKLNNTNQYRAGRSVDVPDEIIHPDGTYRAWLDENDRLKYHTGLQECLLLVEALGGGPVDTAAPPSPPRSRGQDRPRDSPARDRDQDRDRDRDQDRDRDRGRDRPRDTPARDRDRDRDRDQDRDRDRGRDRPRDSPARDRDQDRDRDRDRGRDRPRDTPARDRDEDRDRDRDRGRDPDGRKTSPTRGLDFDRDARQRSPPREQESQRSRPEREQQPRTKQETVLSNINQLIESIKKGDTDKASRLAGQLADRRVRLQTKNDVSDSPQDAIPVQVTIERSNQKENAKEDLIIDVYPSTTVAQLRAAFEYSHEIRPVDQYWFVNGHLAYENSTMSDLKVAKNSLFILFAI